jgi:hypothetical protein
MTLNSHFVVDGERLPVNLFDTCFSAPTLLERSAKKEVGFLYVFLYPSACQFKVGITAQRVQSRFSEVNRVLRRSGTPVHDAVTLRTQETAEYTTKERTLHKVLNRSPLRTD